MAQRIGLIGCGAWGRLILRDLLSCGAEVHVACRTSASLEQALALGARSATSDFCALQQMDGFVVATPISSHAEVLDHLMSTGRPIFVEKPMTADVLSARRLAAAADGRLFVMHKWRYHPAIEAMRAEIVAGRVGEVLAIRTTRWGWGTSHLDVSPLWVLAPHDLSIVLHLIGGIPPVRSALTVTPQWPDIGVTAHLRAESGPTVTLDLGIAGTEHHRRCLVIGSLGTLELRDSYDQCIYVRDGKPGLTGARERSIDVGGGMPLLAEIESFLAFLRGGPPPMSSAGEDLLIVERIAAIETALAANIPTAA